VHSWPSFSATNSRIQSSAEYQSHTIKVKKRSATVYEEKKSLLHPSLTALDEEEDEDEDEDEEEDKQEQEQEQEVN
jgi:hypothetical protein